MTPLNDRQLGCLIALLLSIVIWVGIYRGLMWLTD